MATASIDGHAVAVRGGGLGGMSAFFDSARRLLTANHIFLEKVKRLPARLLSIERQRTMYASTDPYRHYGVNV